MSTPTDQLVAQGVSIWLDDLSRERIVTGNLAELIATRNVVRRDDEPDDLRRCDRRRGHAAYAGQVARARRHTARQPTRRSSRSRPTTSAPPPTCSGRLRRHERGRRPRVDRGLSRPRARHRRDHRAGQGAVGEGGPPERPHQDPRDEGGPARHHRGHRLGHLRQRHPDLQPGALRRGHRGLPRGHRAGQGGRPRPVEDPLRRVVLRVARRHRGGQAPHCHRHRGGDRSEEPRRRRQRAARVRAVREGVRHRPCEERSWMRAPTCSVRCGHRPASRTRRCPTRCTSPSSSHPEPSTRCRRRPSRRPSTTA